jgi:transketolase
MERKVSDGEACRKLEEYAYQIRRWSVEMITWGQWGHIGGSFSMAEILASLYFHEMRVDPSRPDWDTRDRLVLSKAHGSPALYAALALRGFFPMERLYTYCELGGLEGHTDMTKTPGLESSGGPLGQGLSIAVGKALALRYRENTQSRVYCILGDGECNEGQVWEAAMAAGHYHLDNLIAIVDYNKVMAKGFVWDLMGLEPLTDKWRSFGWEVLEVDGHDVSALLRTLHLARYVKVTGKPIVLIAHTVKGRGVDWTEFNCKWHTHAPNPQTADRMLRELARNYGMREEGYSRLDMPEKKETFAGAN